MTIKILMGLPGSGKTTYAENFTKKNHSYNINLDDITKKSYSKCNYTEALQSKLLYPYDKPFNYKYIIIDGPTFTEDDIYTVLHTVEHCINYRNIKTRIDIIIDYWLENREDCIINDIYRINNNYRKLFSTETIKNHEYINLKDFESQLAICNRIQNLFKFINKISVTTHNVYHLPEEEKNLLVVLNNNYTIKKENNNMYLFSDSWCTGGCEGNCWDDTLTVIDGEPSSNFDAFDTIMDNLTPIPSWKNYKKIYSESVTLEENSESDYYGGYTNYNYWKCDLNKLFDLLEEYNYTFKQNN